MSGGCLSDDAGGIRSPQEDLMQHSAGFTSLHAHHADVARAERELEARRLVDERRSVAAEPAAQASVNRRHDRRAQRTTGLATR
jgi:hypothetical protein